MHRIFGPNSTEKRIGICQHFGVEKMVETQAGVALRYRSDFHIHVPLAPNPTLPEIGSKPKVSARRYSRLLQRSRRAAARPGQRDLRSWEPQKECAKELPPRTFRAHERSPECPGTSCRQVVIHTKILGAQEPADNRSDLCFYSRSRRRKDFVA